MTDRFDLQRFVEAQSQTYALAVAELGAGRKRSHWMWFVFPQIEGLGHSVMARRYGLSGLAEACAYLDHPVLGERLRACSRLVADTEGRSIGAIFARPDDLKFHSCMTLFAQVPPFDPVFNACLAKYFLAQPDLATLAILAQL